MDNNTLPIFLLLSPFTIQFCHGYFYFHIVKIDPINSVKLHSLFFDFQFILTSFEFLMFILFYFILFYFWEIEPKQGRSRERDGDTGPEVGSRLCAVSTEPDARLKLMNREIVTLAEFGCLTNWATQAFPILTFEMNAFSWCYEYKILIIVMLRILLQFSSWKVFFFLMLLIAFIKTICLLFSCILYFLTPPLCYLNLWTS